MKLLLYDVTVDYNLGELKDNFGVKCDLPEYMELCKTCFHPKATTPFVAAFARSITVHQFTREQKPENLPGELGLNWGLKELKEFKESYEGELDSTLDGVHGGNRYRMAYLASVHPQLFPTLLLRQLPETIQNVESAEESVDSLVRDLNDPKVTRGLGVKLFWLAGTF